ncbi:YraN family protein [Alcaligenaceae bacterium CGII-47]|nr:YraN family protein [Alcaligenaceae bacterium CGII-47]
MNTDPFDAVQRAQGVAVRRRTQRLRARNRAAAPPHEPPPSVGSPRQRQGYAAEAQAGDYLTGQGLQLLARNLRCKAGEIDLIARDGSVLVFVEVRARHNARFGGAAASVNREKQKKLIRAAQYFLSQLTERHFSGHPPACRFDVVCLEADGLTWIKNAFAA